VKQRTLATILVALFVAPGAFLQSVGGALPGEGVARSVRPDAGLIRLGGGNWHTLTHANQYGVIIISSGNAAYARRQPGRILLYGCGTNMPSDSTSSECGVSYAQAVANNWILKDSSGDPVHYKGSYMVLTDIGNAAYQRRFVAEINADLRKHPGLDGVFIDDVTGSLVGNGTAIPAKYPDNKSYRAAMLSFLKAIGPALKAKGWYVAVNASILDGALESVSGPAWDGTQFIWWVKRIRLYVNGINMEHWEQNWDSNDSVRVSGSAGSQAWDGWLRVASTVQGLGRDFFAMTEGALTDVKKAAYLRASFLLAWKRGRGAFIYTDDYSGKGDPWTLVATPRIGRPLTPKIRVGVGFRRTFTNGVVVLNPDASRAQAFRFQRTYLVPDGTPTRSVFLPPATGLVLERAPRH
jgi:hypothetical protein